MSQCSVALLLYRRYRIRVGSLVTYVCVCGRITSLGFSVDWTSSSLSRVDLSGLSWHRSCPGYLWEAAVVWAPAYSAVYLCLCWPLNAVCHNIASSSSNRGSTLVIPGTRSHMSPYRLTSTTQPLCNRAKVYHKLHNIVDRDNTLKWHRRQAFRRMNLNDEDTTEPVK